MTVLRWKLNKSCSTANHPAAQRPEKPVNWAFINIESPAQLTSPEIQRKVRRHVAATAPKAQSRQATSTQAVDQKTCTRSERLMTVTTYLESVQVCQHFQRVFRAVGLSDCGALRLALDDTVTDFSCGTGDADPISNDALAIDSLKRYTTSLRTVRAMMIQTRNGEDRYQATGIAICLAFYDMRVGNSERWALHMGGVQMIVTEAGGFGAIASFGHLREALYMTDVAGSLVFNTPPRFSQFTMSAMALSNPSKTTRVDQAPPAESIHATADLSRELFTIAHDLLVLPQLQATNTNTSPLWTSEQASMREAVRQAALAAVACVLTTSSQDDTYCARHRNGKIRKLVCSTSEYAWKGMEELQLWVLAVAALIENDEDRTWLTGQIANSMYQRGLYVWDDLVHLLRRVAWSETLAVQDTARFKSKVEQALEERLAL
ncbi:hypothetical protein LMH87_000022 [Akanthomyces muscarius]|uniref:Uncharacterized protein n=1 Tax=Akanthomyces muscarius TaxID=2231603 RepID=A0A9W8UKR0_AKAMU|nr:hypothetical protein LMH87_000022 [Akanthomyces muscarius]KAJ4154743.1 hypothetical protein LMH87_000022 [Akanthomyces muscarius]